MDWERQGVGPHTNIKKAIPQIRVDKIDKEDSGNCGGGLPQSKSDSDLGGSCGSMPNITFALTDTDVSPEPVQQDDEQDTNRRTGSKLNVYCSPRMSRKSFQDGDAVGDKGCWFEGFDSSRSLLSLRSSVQLGSTTSLDTNFTGRSLGLLSDDSERTFLSDKPVCPNSPTKKLLRRFFSDPENGPDADKNINRSSQSWTDLKDAQLGFVNMEEIVEKGFVNKDTRTGGIDIQAVLNNLNEGDIGGDSANLVSPRHRQKTLSEGRIRQWLHDLNTEQQQHPVVDIPE